MPKKFTKTITFRCTEEQYKVWQEKAEQFDMSQNAYIRMALNTLSFMEKPILRRAFEDKAAAK